jgi:LysW-gamma-L-alpha-aminoadipyl-6-phosphate/LysW-L-glutamyl-5-phosphate reductase
VTKVRAVILGAAGYGGGELLRILSRHPAVAALQAVSRSHAGRPVYTAHPNLRGLCDAAFSATPDFSAGGDEYALAVFSARRNGELAADYAEIGAALNEAQCARKVLIDLSGDFRLSDAGEYRNAYGLEHPFPHALGNFVYGLPEANRALIAEAERIASPGCFATAIALALLPFADAQFAGPVAVFAATGSSGSGAHPSETTHHPTRANDFRAYKMLAHQHEAEILALLASRGATPRIGFVPHSTPLVRGIFASLHFELPQADAAHAEQRVRDYYAGEPFVRVVEGSPRVAAVAGSNFCELGVASRGTQVVVLSALDNLLKGMAGQAVQSMNIALGLSETAGLDFAGAWPY